MQSIYLFCLVFGGLFVLLAAFAGLDGVDFDHDFDPDVELTEEPEPQTSRFTPAPRRLWLPFLSLRFWTFGSCFFGLVGLGLSQITPPLPGNIILLLALVIGLFCGTTAVWVLRLLKKRNTNSLIRTQDLVGVSGVVTLPFNAQNRGKVRLSIKGSRVELIAYTEEPKDLRIGETVFVVGMEKNHIWVVSETSLAVKNSNTKDLK